MSRNRTAPTLRPTPVAYAYTAPHAHVRAQKGAPQRVPRGAPESERVLLDRNAQTLGLG